MSCRQPLPSSTIVAMESHYPIMGDVEPMDQVRSVDDERAHRKKVCAIGYRIFGEMRWGQLGDGHISARDPEFPDHFWLLSWGVPFRQATVGQLVLVGPDGRVAEGKAGSPSGEVNTAGYNIHWPVHEARPDAVSAAHTHIGYGTPWSANVAPFQAISQESNCFMFDQSLFDDEEVEVLTTAGGQRIAESLGGSKLCILRNHGFLTVGGSVEEAVGWFVLAERAAEVHVKSPNAIPISDEGAKIAASTLGIAEVGWRVFHWLARDLVPDPSVLFD